MEKDRSGQQKCKVFGGEMSQQIDGLRSNLYECRDSRRDLIPHGQAEMLATEKALPKQPSRVKVNAPSRHFEKLEEFNGLDLEAKIHGTA